MVKYIGFVDGELDDGWEGETEGDNVGAIDGAFEGISVGKSDSELCCVSVCAIDVDIDSIWEGLHDAKYLHDCVSATDGCVCCYKYYTFSVIVNNTKYVTNMGYMWWC